MLRRIIDYYRMTPGQRAIVKRAKQSVAFRRQYIRVLTTNR